MSAPSRWRDLLELTKPGIIGGSAMSLVMVLEARVAMPV